MKSLTMERNDNLTKEDELELGRQIQAYLKAEEDVKTAKDSEKEELFEIIRVGQAAYEKLVGNYINLARDIAYRHHRKTGTRYSSEDLIQDALWALCSAAYTYDPSKNCKLSTHAYYAITKKVSVRINQERFVRLPENKMGEYYEIKKAEAAWKELSDEEKAKVDLDDFIVETTGLPQQEIDLIFSIMRPIISLQAPINELGTGELQDLVADPESGQLEYIDNYSELDNPELVELLRGLTPFERDLIAFEYNAFPPSVSFQDFLVKYNMNDTDITRETRKAIRKMKRVAAKKNK